MTTHAEALTLVQGTLALLHEIEGGVLCSPEDAAFFRQKHKPSTPVAPTVVPPPIVFTPPPAPPKPPEPILSPAPTFTPPPPAPKPPEPVLTPTPVFTPPPPLPTAPTPTLLRTLLATVAPELTLLPDIPSDTLAKKIATRWKTHNQIAPITLLHYQELPEQTTFLEQLAKAVDVYFGPARLVNAERVEKENQWDAFLSVNDLKVVIACDHTLWQLPNLRNMYREIPTQEKRLLKEKPLFLLPDLALYLKDPMLKRSLWKALCSFLSSSTKT